MAESYINCRDCGEEFDPRSPLHRGVGFFNQCCNCAHATGAEADIIRHVGLHTGEGKGGQIRVERGWRGQQLAAHARRSRYNANLPLGSYSTAMDSMSAADEAAEGRQNEKDERESRPMPYRLV